MTKVDSRSGSGPLLAPAGPEGGKIQDCTVWPMKFPLKLKKKKKERKIAQHDSDLHSRVNLPGS